MWKSKFYGACALAFTAPCEAAEQFNVITNTAIADGVITDA